MNFVTYTDAWAFWKKSAYGHVFKTDEDFYTSELFEDPLSFRHAEFELNWRKTKKPYYDVYPCIIPMLKSLKLDFPSCQISKPHGLSQLLIRLPESEKCRIIWVSFGLCADKVGSSNLVNGLSIGMDFGERIERNNVQLPVNEVRIIPLTETNLDDTLDSLVRDPTSFGDEPDYDLLLDYTKLAITICMLGDDKDLIEPQVLTDDERKLTVDNLDRLVQKARNRGKFGFSVGKNIQSIMSEDGRSPHYRKPHLAVVHYGKGRVESKVILRKGSFINKDKLLEVPTGYLDD